jgi:hypothetical protein
MRTVRLTSAMKMDNPYIVGDIGAELTLPDHAALMVVRLNNGVYTDIVPEPMPQFTRAELERHEEAIKLKKLDAPSADKPEEEIKRPVANAPKSTWIRYAVSVDEKLSEERAELMTKADLMSRYGERL